MSVVAVMNQKGGVGKTTLTFNLGKGLKAENFKVVLIDNDSQGHLTLSLLSDPSHLKSNVLGFYEEPFRVLPQILEPNLDFIGANSRLSKATSLDFKVIFRLRDGLKEFQNAYDFVLIDSGPSSDLLQTAVLNATDFVLIPATPSPYSVDATRKFIEAVKEVKKWSNPNLKILGIVLNMVSGVKSNVERTCEEAIRKEFSEYYVFSNFIPRGAKMLESPCLKKSIMEYDSHCKVSLSFLDFICEFIQRVDSLKVQDLDSLKSEVVCQKSPVKL